jgi:type II secretory pathway component GspD/PulD (secretin)
MQRSLFLISIFVVFLFHVSARAQALKEIGMSRISESLQLGLNRTIYLDLRDINVIDVIKFLAIEGDLNIVTSKNVQGRSTLLLKNVTIHDALDIIILSNQLAYEIKNNIIYVMSEDEYVEMFGKNYNDQRKVLTRTLAYAKPTYVVSALQSLQTAVGKVIVDEETGSVVMIDTPDALVAMEELLEKLEQGVNTRVVKLKYAEAKMLEAHLQNRLDAKGVGSVFADERSNQLVVTAYPGRMGEIIPVIHSLDREEKAVMIDVRIIQLTLSPKFDMGIDWRSLLGHNANGFISQLDFDNAFPIDTTSGVASATHQGKLTVGRLAEERFEFELKALKQVDETRTLASPRLMVLNGEEAKINIGDTLAYVVTTSTGTGSNVTTSEDIRFIDIGVILSVTPTINDDGFVTMKISPEISSKTGELTTASNNTVPLVNKTTVESTIVVQDGVTVVLGGLKNDQVTEDSRGIPFLMDIPLIGQIFKSRNESVKKQEIAIFITPKIITGGESMTDETLTMKPARSFRTHK